MRKGEDYYLPETLFKGYTADDLKRLKESNVFLLTQFRPTKEGKDRETVISRQIQSKGIHTVWFFFYMYLGPNIRVPSWIFKPTIVGKHW